MHVQKHWNNKHLTKKPKHGFVYWGSTRLQCGCHASVAFPLSHIKTRFFSLLATKVHAVRSAKFKYLDLSKSQERNNAIIFNNIKENKINFKPLGNLVHPLWFFFTLLPPQALPEEDFYHCEKLSIQAEIIVKNTLNSTSHSAISVQRAWSLERCLKSDGRYRFII